MKTTKLDVVAIRYKFEHSTNMLTANCRAIIFENIAFTVHAYLQLSKKFLIDFVLIIFFILLSEQLAIVIKARLHFVCSSNFLEQNKIILKKLTQRYSYDDEYNRAGRVDYA